jgi:hypothetical protein
MYISGRFVTGVLESLDFTPLLRQAQGEKMEA